MLWWIYITKRRRRRRRAREAPDWAFREELGVPERASEEMLRRIDEGIARYAIALVLALSGVGLYIAFTFALAHVLAHIFG